MKKLLIFLTAVYSVDCYAVNLSWYVDDNLFAYTVCENGNNIVFPEKPVKEGYTFNGWYGGYTELEYLQSSGTQWIDAGFAYDATMSKLPFKIDYTVAILKHNTYHNTYNNFGGVFEGGKGVMVLMHYNYNSESLAIYNNVMGQGRIAQSLPFPGLENKVRIIFTREPNQKPITIYNAGSDDMEFVSNYYDDLYSDKHLQLFYAGSSSQGSVTPIRLYHIMYESNNIPLRDFIPVLDESGIAAMYDKVTHNYFYNSGTGNFIVGPAIKKQIQISSDLTETIKCPENDTSIHALFEPNTLTLNWDYKDGRTMQTQCVYDTLINIPDDPVRQGYKFMGWRVKEVKN